MGPILYDDLDGQVVLVTGANRGIGEQIAADLTEFGATVYAGAVIRVRSPSRTNGRSHEV